jgi:hypothetical protein
MASANCAAGTVLAHGHRRQLSLLVLLAPQEQLVRVDAVLTGHQRHAVAGFVALLDHGQLFLRRPAAALLRPQHLYVR